MLDFENRLTRLKSRRVGPEAMILEKAGIGQESSESININETYESLAQSNSVKYAIGSMLAVSDRSTEISIEEGERVAGTLKGLLKTDEIEIDFRMQGSVPLDIHIKHHSDVDMLIITRPTLLVESPKVDSSRYVDASDKRPMTAILAELRHESEVKLTSRYHGVKVCCDNAKSIAMSGGSLKRKVDIVPACWFDTIDYQKSRAESDRGIRIYDKHNNKLIGNSPFKHIQLVNDKDAIYQGNLKKCVRLLKNLVADIEDKEEKKLAEHLSSFDLVGIVYNMDDALNVNQYTPLLLVSALESELKRLQVESTKDIYVPDGSRLVFDNPDKLKALVVVHKVVRELMKAIYSDLAPDDFLKQNENTLRETEIILEESM